MKREELNSILRNVTLIGQLGLTVMMPMLLCIAFAWYLTSHTGVGLWVYIPAFFFGLGSSFMTAYKFYQSQIQKDKKENKKQKVSFNNHD